MGCNKQRIPEMCYHKSGNMQLDLWQHISAIPDLWWAPLKILQHTVANLILFSNISNSNNIYKFRVDIFTHQGHINQAYQTARSELVS